MITLYGLVSELKGAMAFSFEEIALNYSPGVIDDGGQRYPNRLTPPIKVEVPEGSTLHGTPLMLQWSKGDTTHHIDSKSAYSFARSAANGFKLVTDPTS